LSRDLGIRASAVVSRTGLSAQVMSAARPAAPIVALSSDPAICRRLRLSWGLVPVFVSAEELIDAPTAAVRAAMDLELCPAGERLLLVQGFQTDPAASRPSITVLTAG
jgi:pyruvate kinase